MEEPKAKKVKVEDGDDAEKAEEKSESDDDSAVPEEQQNDAGEAFFELSKSRRVTVRTFKGRALVDIREFYEKGDKLLPGKKGISLTLEQFRILEALMQSGNLTKLVDELE